MIAREIIERIKYVKQEKDVLILSHYYMPAELQFGVQEGGFVDFVGDSLGLSMQAANTKAQNILFCGVRFMAETALLVNENKQVFMPNPSAGCSLAASISAEDIIKLKAHYPGVPVMGYINTYAETKAELDICCTSRNALAVAASLPGDKIIFVPDLYMGQNLQTVIKKELGKELLLWQGSCEVHEKFKFEMANMRDLEAGEFLFHWEVPASVTQLLNTQKSGMIGSTNDILNHVKNSKQDTFYLASECDLGIALKKENPHKNFITPCITCAYMKQNSLQNLLLALEAIQTPSQSDYQVLLDEALITRAKIPVLKMMAIQA